jgi:lactoylglutathione lyase
MKRFHVHLHVNDLDKNIGFYSALFNQPPTRTESDYAKWMLEDPPVNFAISTRGTSTGVDHLGFQVSSADELGALKTQAQAGDMALLDEGETTCCYARSDKYWITDPQGLAWEQFHTLGNIPVFNEAGTSEAAATACCAPKAPAATARPVSIPLAAAPCCGPSSSAQPSGCC